MELRSKQIWAQNKVNFNRNDISINANNIAYGLNC